MDITAEEVRSLENMDAEDGGVGEGSDVVRVDDSGAGGAVVRGPGGIDGGGAGGAVVRGSGGIDGGNAGDAVVRGPGGIDGGGARGAVVRGPGGIYVFQTRLLQTCLLHLCLLDHPLLCLLHCQHALSLSLKRCQCLMILPKFYTMRMQVLELLVCGISVKRL